MSLFDLFKKKEPNSQDENSAETKNNDVNKNNKEPYQGDLKKTGIIYQLIQTPPNERDDNWANTFLQKIGQASFRCGDPQIITGPDGYPYFKLLLPEPNKAFQCYVIEKMKDDFLLPNVFGLVINLTENIAYQVFSYGYILNFHLNKTFYTSEKTPFSKETNDETLTENEEIMIAQPSDAILPAVTRKLIRDFLVMNGIKNPKILLMVRGNKNEKGITQDLVFNITPQQFINENTYRSVMQTISWYLPRHYSFVGMEENSLENGFMPL